MSDEKVTLRDVYDAVNRLEDKFIPQINLLRAEQDELKSRFESFSGKIGTISFVVTIVFTAVINLFFDQIKHFWTKSS